MAHSTESLNQITESINQLATETILIRPGGDEGLIPVFCLLGELAELDNASPYSEAAHQTQKKVSARLDIDPTWDGPTLESVHSFINWAQLALTQSQAGQEPFPYQINGESREPAAGPQTFGEAEPGSSSSSAQHAEERARLAAEIDVLLELNPEDDVELLQEFQIEAVDHLEQIESSLLTIEKDPDDRESLNSLFRSFHTLKGVAGFLNLIPLQKLAHELESVLDRARNNEIVLGSTLITGILRGKDAIEELVGQITQCLNEGIHPKKVVPVADIIWEVKCAADGVARPADAGKSAPAGNKEPSEKHTGSGKHLISSTSSDRQALPNTLDLAQSLFGQTIHSTDATQDECAEEETDASIPDSAPPFTFNPQIQSAPAARPKPAPAPKPAASAEAAPAPRRSKNAEDNSIRVSTQKLDSLMDMVGELVIVQSQIRENTARSGQENMALQRGIAQLSRITKELQHTSMALRMLPIKQTFQKAGRMVRDISAKLNKKVEFVMSGEETELDRNVIELIGDPLVHMIRNAIDHGLENAEERLQTGKAPVGIIHLKAFHEGGNIIIELSDDGRGLNTDRIFKKAVERGIVSPESQLTKNEIENLIFAPGFSTAEVVTDLSGRGVGMDVVRRNIESLRGSVEVSSELGHGSTFRIKLPLTMAIIDGLIVRVGAERFIVPTPTIKVALKPNRDQLSKIQGNVEVLDLRGKTLPIVRLHEQFNICGAKTDLADGILVIIETVGRPIALFVDEMVNKQEVVIKTLGSLVGRIEGVAGGAILGDGNIALILDPGGLKSKRTSPHRAA